MRDKEIVICVSDKELKEWNNAYPLTQFNSLSEFIRESINMLVDIINSDEQEQIVVRVEEWEH